MSINQELVYKLPLHHIRSYLQLENWSIVNENERWLVFEDDGSIEIAIPKNTRAPDYHVYIDNAVRKLSSLMDKDSDAVADDILSFDLDVFSVTVDHAMDTSSIRLKHANTIVSELKRLFTFAASSAIEAKPYFRDAPQKAKDLLDHFRFGHTVRGSYGCRIECKIKTNQLTQFTLFGDGPEPVRPLERETMERIVKGLAATDKAAESGNVSLLMEGYDEGLNANMCTAILNLYDETQNSVDYSIKWSKKVKVPSDLRNVSKITISRSHLEYLEKASEHLYRQDPKHISIVGYVTDLSQMGPDRDVLGDGAITIQRLTPEGRTQKVHVVVDEESHSKAVDAYRESKTVGVDGFLEYKSQKWRLMNPEKFRIVS